jgi:hypothetical protein
MRRVIVESPYRGASQAERLRNVSYLKRCLRDCIMRGESPYASRGLLPGALEEDRAGRTTVLASRRAMNGGNVAERM